MGPYSSGHTESGVMMKTLCVTTAFLLEIPIMKNLGLFCLPAIFLALVTTDTIAAPPAVVQQDIYVTTNGIASAHINGVTIYANGQPIGVTGGFSNRPGSPPKPLGKLTVFLTKGTRYNFTTDRTLPINNFLAGSKAVIFETNRR